MIKVSIVIPVYNSEKYISRCLESVINQSYKNIEILTINDGSSDNSLKILKNYEKKYKNIRAIDKQNEGVAKTRNLGISKATGDYIMFIDNDDYIDENYVEKYIHEIDDGAYDIIMGGYRRINDTNKVLFCETLPNTKWSKYIIMAPWAKLYKREFLIKNNIVFLSYEIGEDVYFNLLAYSKNPKIKIINYIGYNWFFNTKSVSNTTQKGLNKDIDITYLLDNINNNYKNKSDNELLNYFYFRYYIWYLLFSGKNSTSKDFMCEYMKIKKWMSKNNINNKIFPFSSKLKGESFKNRIIVFIFLMIEKLHLINLFAKVYCKGGN